MKKDNAYLEHIIDAITAIEDFLLSKNKEDFLNSDLLQSAIMRKLEIIGEATKNLSPELKRGYNKVSWRGASGMRDILIHEYFGVDVERVWKTITKAIPKFKEQVSDILEELKE